MVPSPRFNLGPYSSYVLPTFRGSRLVLMLTPLLLSGIYSCGFKGSDSNSAHTECVDRYSTDECGSFDVEMFFKIDATIECNVFFVVDRPIRMQLRKTTSMNVSMMRFSMTLRTGILDIVRQASTIYAPFRSVPVIGIVSL